MKFIILFDMDKKAISILRHAIEEKGKISMPLEGNSMFPTLKKDTIVDIEKVHPYDLKRGDIVAFSGKNTNSIVVHRIMDITKLNNDILFTTKGDFNLYEDTNRFGTNQVLGIVKKAYDKEKSYRNLILLDNYMALYWTRFLFLIKIRKIFKKNLSKKVLRGLAPLSAFISRAFVKIGNLLYSLNRLFCS